METATVSIIASQKRAIPMLESIEELEVRYQPKMINGIYQQMINWMIWLTIYAIACKKLRNPIQAWFSIRSLARLRDAYKEKNQLVKYAKVDNRVYFSFNAPGWPSRAFNRFIEHQLLKTNPGFQQVSLHTVILGITKKCGYKCEHCFEWNNLNQPETLTKEELFQIIERFQQTGVTQFQLSGGEPLNRLNDIIEIVKRYGSRSDFWLYTSGYQLSEEKAAKLKAAGVTGVAISIDHWQAEKHDQFRGKQYAFYWAKMAATNAANAGLTVCLSLCATQQFTTENNLFRYAQLANSLKASFIQVLEPRSVGHYAGKAVGLSRDQQQILDKFYLQMNYDPSFKKYPMVIYHGFYTRRISCAGSGEDYLYVDMDGFAHACPFCQSKSFHVLKDNLELGIQQMRTQGCGLIKSN